MDCKKADEVRGGKGWLNGERIGKSKRTKNALYGGGGSGAAESLESPAGGGTGGTVGGFGEELPHRKLSYAGPINTNFEFPPTNESSHGEKKRNK